MTKRAIVQATQVMIAFQIEGDGEQDIRDLIKLLTSVGLFLFGAWRWVSRKWRKFKTFWQDCRIAASGVTLSEVITRAAKPLTFGFSSVVLGTG